MDKKAKNNIQKGNQRLPDTKVKQKSLTLALKYIDRKIIE
jgi:hypothetical protein